MTLFLRLILLITLSISALEASVISTKNIEISDEELSAAIKKINYEGSRSGQSDGVMDGADLSAKLAFERGSVDGKYDGLQQAITECGTLIRSSTTGNTQRKTPDYPVDFIGPNHKPKINHSNPIMIKAFADGYNLSYKLYARLEFQRRISTDYNQIYETHYRSAYDMALSSECFDLKNELKSF